jgi:crotonobetainyl-CoA:carnitine CoA-transferase CaiB-like acyl-CoA transferase
MAHFKDISTDPQAWANGFLEHVEFRSGNVDIMPSSPIEMNSAEVPPTRPAPAAGTHTAAILRSLGYSEAQVEAMLASGSAVAAEEAKV